MPKVAKRRPFPLGWVAAPEMGRGLLLRGGEPRPQGLSTVVPVGMVAMITMSPASTLLAPITVASLMINGMILVLLLGLLSTFLVFGMRTFSRAWLLALLIAPVAWNLCLGLMDTKACATLVQRDKLNHDAVRFGYLWAGVVHATVPHMSLTRRFCVGAWFQLIMGVGGTFAFFVQMGDVRFGRIPLLNVCIPSLVGFCVARLVRHDDDATQKDIMTLFKEVHYMDGRAAWDVDTSDESFETYLAPQVAEQRRYLEALAEDHARFFD